MKLGSENERLIAALEGKGPPLIIGDAEVIAKKLRAWGSALEWIATHDGTGLTNARKVQNVAARALYHEEGPDE